jgi:hypothetical protein
MCGLVSGVGAGLSAGLTLGEIDRSVIPNEGMRRSARNALSVALVFALVIGLVGGAVAGLVHCWRGMLMIGGVRSLLIVMQGGLVNFGLFFGVVLGLEAGGMACIKHVVLRLWLIRKGSTPWSYVRFLDHAAERLLLRKVGGGYAFIHRMLLDYFAAQYVEPSSGDAQADVPSSTKDELQTV